MIAKCYEVRDSCTYVPVLAVKLEPSNEADRYLLATSGYGLTPQSQAEYIEYRRIYRKKSDEELAGRVLAYGARTDDLSQRLARLAREELERRKGQRKVQP